jgi:23S rRNA pseudouridine1911/1915/1917 synthase
VNSEIKILYQDEDMLAIYKPSGITVHPEGRSQGPFVTDWVLENFKDVYEGEPIDLDDGDSISRPGIVHRLDKETSGVMLIAKTKEGFDCLKEQFLNMEIQKTYHTFVEGVIKDDRGVINKPIGRLSSDPRKRAVGSRTSNPKEAQTAFKVLSRLSGETFLEVWPKTGRTHQLRVHLKSIHHPIVADFLYGKRENSLGFKRLALHARKIAFTNLDSQKVVVEAPYPEDFINALNKGSLIC